MSAEAINDYEVPKVGRTAYAVGSAHRRKVCGRRDAFHTPGVLVTSLDRRVTPGQPVRFLNDREESYKPFQVVEPCARNEAHAIVDPFIMSNEIGVGRLFWVFILPEAGTNLRHEFDIDIDKLDEQRQHMAAQELADAIQGKRDDADDDSYDDSCASCY